MVKNIAEAVEAIRDGADIASCARQLAQWSNLRAAQAGMGLRKLSRDSEAGWHAAILDVLEPRIEEPEPEPEPEPEDNSGEYFAIIETARAATSLWKAYQILLAADENGWRFEREDFDNFPRTGLSNNSRSIAWADGQGEIVMERGFYWMSR